jgi:hypothetical protein
MQAKRPKGPALSGQRPPLPARAMPAQVKLASPADPVYPIRRTGLGPAPITCLIHLPPPAVCCRVQVRQLHILITHHVIRFPGPAVRAATGYHRPAQSWPAAPVAIIAPGPRSIPAADSADSRAGHTTRIPSACPPPLIQSRRSPTRYRPGPRCAARDQRHRENTSKRTLPGRLNPDLPPGQASSSRHERAFSVRIASA